MYNDLAKIVGSKNVLVKEPMHKHTSFKVGGPADFFVRPKTLHQLGALIKYLSDNSIRYFVMGNGTNLIFEDSGYKGVIIQLSDNFSDFYIDDVYVTAHAGTRLSAIANAICEVGLAGFEFAAGIPGTIGGAVTMNAGAYGGEMKDVVVRTECLDSNGNSIILEGDDHAFDYRKSAILEQGLLVTKTRLRLERGNPLEIRNKITELNGRRKEKQPLDMPSAGSAFKRPEGHYAGKLIQDCGLQGYTIGGAQVSNKHCGFIVNTGNATSKDIISLIEYIKESVYKKFGVKLETEVKFVEG